MRERCTWPAPSSTDNRGQSMTSNLPAGVSEADIDRQCADYWDALDAEEAERERQADREYDHTMEESIWNSEK